MMGSEETTGASPETGLAPRWTATRCLKAVAILSASVTMFLFGTHSCAVLTATGTGTVTNKIGRDEDNTPAYDARSVSGLRIELDGRTLVRVPPTELWNKLQNGDRIEKRRGSYSYAVNGVENNTFADVLGSAARLGVFVFLFWCAILLMFSMLRTPQQPATPGRETH